MESNEAFVLTEKGLFRMDANYRWSFKEAPSRGLRDPWAHRPDIPLRTEEIISLIEGKEVTGTKLVYPDVAEEAMAAWRVERDEYMRQRDEWIAMQVFDEYGYEDFLAEARDLSEDFREGVRPCESIGNPQCSLFCPIYNQCVTRTYIQDWKEMKRRDAN